MPTPNVELLTKTLAHIKANPKEWDQSNWRVKSECGTAMCFAGWAVTLAGGKWSDQNLFSDFVAAVPEDGKHAIEGLTYVSHRAVLVLGLTKVEADDLFHPENNIRYLEQAVAELCAKAAAEVDHVEPKPTGR